MYRVTETTTNLRRTGAVPHTQHTTKNCLFFGRRRFSRMIHLRKICCNAELMKMKMFCVFCLLYLPISVCTYQDITLLSTCFSYSS